MCGLFFFFSFAFKRSCSVRFVNNVNNHPECIVHLCGFRDGRDEGEEWMGMGMGGDPCTSKTGRCLKCEAIFFFFFFW